MTREKEQQKFSVLEEKKEIQHCRVDKKILN
jgi:hypothetical protein